MDLPVTIPLQRPIVLGAETISDLTFDEPDLKAQIAYAELEQTFADPPSDADSYRVTQFWISHLAGISLEAAGRIKETDMPKVTATMHQVLGMPDLAQDDVSSGNEDPAA